MSRKDDDREKLIQLVTSNCDYARLGYNISTQNNCNTCKDRSCKYRPDLGDPVRWNCPLWKGKQNDH